MKELIKLIKEFKYNKEDLESLSALLPTLKGLPSVLIKIEKGRSIYRCRNNNPPSQLYFSEKDISYRTDLKNITGYGRANIPYDSKFYGSLASGSIEHGHAISIMETSKMLREDTAGLERFTVGQWEVEETFEALTVPPFGNADLSDLNSDLVAAHENYYAEYGVSDVAKELYNLIGAEFAKRVDSKSNIEYAISAMFSNSALNKVPAIAYTSVQAQHEGYNIVLTPQAVDRFLKFKQSLLVDHFKFENRSFIINRAHGTPTPLIDWETLETDEYAHIDDILDFFESKGIGEREMIKSLLFNASIGL